MLCLCSVLGMAHIGGVGQKVVGHQERVNLVSL